MRQKAIYHNNVIMASWLNKPDGCHNGCPNLTPVQLHSRGGDGEQTEQWRELQGFMQCYLIDKIYIDLSVENKITSNICSHNKVIKAKLFVYNL